MRIGIYGGAFDPIHLGHLLLAETCLRQARLDRLIFVPTGVSPHRKDKDYFAAEPEDRLRMIELSIEHYDEFWVSRFEIDRTEKSFTLDTIQYFVRLFGLVQPELCFVVGADTFFDLPNWYEIEEVLKLALPIVADRPGTPTPDFNLLRDKLSPEQFEALQANRIEMPQIDLSSSRIRKQLEQGESIRFQVPREVEEYIKINRIYQKKLPGEPTKKV